MVRIIRNLLVGGAFLAFFMGAGGSSVFAQGTGASGGASVNINLYATIEAESFENTISEFDARNVELMVNGRLNSRLTGAAEIEFERSKAAGKGVPEGEDYLGAIEVEQGWVQYKIHEILNIRSGVILVPFGEFNLNHFDPSRDLTDRPIMMRRVIPTTWAEAGTGILGTLFFGDNTVVDYQVYTFNGLGDDADGNGSFDITDKGLRNARGTFGRDTGDNKMQAGRLNVSYRQSRIAGSFFAGGYNKESDKIKGWDVDGKLTLGPLELLGEYAQIDIDGESKFSNFPPPPDDPSFVEPPGSMRGGYAQANYHFWFGFLNNTFLGKDFEDPTFTAVTRYGFARIADDGDGGGKGVEGYNYEKRFTVGLNYRPVETFVFKFEYQNNRSSGESLERGNNNGYIGSMTAVF